MWWDEERIRWYVNASRKTEFHTRLASFLESFLSKNEEILEVGCGLGYVAEILKNDGFDIIATDNDEKAIEEARSRSSLDIFSSLDASFPLPHSNTLLMIFFGRLGENSNLERYLANTDRIIYVLSEHRGQSDRLRKKEGEIERTISLLDSYKSIRYIRYPFSASFDQTLDSAEDAERYITRMYGDKRKAEYMKFLIKDGDHLVLPNMKHTSIFIIEKRRNAK